MVARDSLPEPVCALHPDESMEVFGKGRSLGVEGVIGSEVQDATMVVVGDVG